MEVCYKKEVSKIRKLGIMLSILYCLNLSDLFFTKYLLWEAPNLFYEANVFLSPIINSIQAYLLKIVVFGSALIYWYFRSKKSTDKQLKRSLVVSRIFLGIYIGINLLHVYNFMLLFSL